MKKASTLLLACTLAICSFAQNQVSTQPQKNTKEEQDQAFLSTIGGLAAAYVLTAQDQIDAQVAGFSAKNTTAEIANQKLMMQKNIIAILQDQTKKLQTTNAIGPDSPDHSFILDFNTTLDLMIKEIDLGINYIKDSNASNKTQFDTGSAQATKKIKALLGME